jgi:hypothetical protein
MNDKAEEETEEEEDVERVEDGRTVVEWVEE